MVFRIVADNTLDWNDSTYETGQNITYSSIHFARIGQKGAAGIVLEANTVKLAAPNILNSSGSPINLSESGSDLRIKNSIEVLSEKYEKFFDSLLPKRYKYNNGTANRYHTGYIAQEVVESLTSSGLTTQDFAGVVLYSPNSENECWHLRRDEFVALNTWQIQKLKSRVSELEKEIENLKFR